MSIPKDIDKWDNNKWTQQVVNCRPSSGGAVGVIFVWAGMAYSRQNVQDAKMAAFVIKPIQGSAAPTKFAEHVLTKIGGALSPNSKPIPRRSYSGSGLVMTLKMFRDKETDPAIKARWQAVFQNYDRADTFLIQETQVGIKEFGDVASEQSGLAVMLSDQLLVTNLGKLFAVDTLLGNGDRVGNMNTGNIVFKTDGTLCSIDSTTVLTNFNDVLEQSRRLAQHALDDVARAESWANRAVNFGNTAVMTPRQENQMIANAHLAMPIPVVTTPPASFRDIYDLDSWWEGTFKASAVSHLTNRKDQNGSPLPDLPNPPDVVWNQAKVWFKLGVEQGMRDIDLKLSGLNWLLIKNSYKNYVNRYGGDPNLDWTNFKLRRRYIKLRNKKLTHDQALVDIKEYAARKFPGL